MGILFRDKDFYIVDSNLDGGDSANRAGFATLFGLSENLSRYEISPGILVRHPNQSPWNHPGNFSRDQLLPFVAGAWRLGLYDLNRRILKAHAKRFFFCQNLDRDAPGTRKYPWPHRFITDRNQIESRAFDFADPLSPSDIWHLILCARAKPFYLFGLIGYPALAIEILLHGIFSRSNDEGQIISKAWVGGSFFVWLYKKAKPNWKEALHQYWVSRRKMLQMYELIVSKIEKSSYR